MNSGAKILLIVFGSAALVGVITVIVMRFVIRLSGRQQLVENGVVLTESGIEYLGFLFTGVRKNAFREIRSVELVPYYKVLISSLLLRYGISTNRIPPHFFSKIVIIRLKHPSPIEYLFFKPKDASSFVEQLESRIDKVG